MPARLRTRVAPKNAPKAILEANSATLELDHGRVVIERGQKGRVVGWSYTAIICKRDGRECDS